MGLFDFFKKRSQGKVSFENLLKATELVVVKGYRSIAQANNISPTTKLSDAKIIEIYKKVGSGFREVSKQRNEHLPAGYLNTIVLKFYAVYEMMGKEMYPLHLKYELEKYLREGLREDYKKDLKLF